MLLSKVMEGLIRLFGNVKFADSTHALDGGLFAAFGGLSQASRRKRRKAGKASTINRDSMAGSVNTQMMLDRFSTHTTAGPISPDGIGNTGYFPGQTPGGWPVLRSPNTGYAPVDSSHEEVLQDETAPRGFSVIRGGKATYKDPYRSVPADAGPSTPNDFSYQLRPILSPTQTSRQGAGPTGRHSRTKSQTAVIESLPSSHSDSPKSMYPPLGGSGENTPTWSPTTTPTAESFFARDFARPVPSQRNPRDERQQVESPTSEQGESGKRSRPTSWFGLGSRRNTQVDSDDEEELDDYGARVDPEPSRHGNWFSSLGLSSDKRTRSSVDEQRVDENALRKSNDVVLNDEPNTRSFKVNRNKSSSTSRTSQSVPPSPTVVTMPDLPQDALRQVSQPQRSFVVKRANQSGQNSANASQQASPVGLPAALPIALDANKPEPTGKSFVVNRQNRPGPAVSFAPPTSWNPPPSSR
jgi:hypothetical protein